MAKLQEIYDSIEKGKEQLTTLEEQLMIAKENNFTDIIISIEKTIANIKKDIEYLKNAFCNLFYATYNVNCNLIEGIIVLDDNEVDDTFRLLKEDLRKYMELFQKEGFNNEKEFSVITANHNKLEAYNKKLFDLILYRNDESSFIREEADISVISKKYKKYAELEVQYEKFIRALKFNGEIEISESVIDYLIQNTHLLPLVYANAREDSTKIPGINSLYRKFNCQFHVEKKPSLRVSVNKNYFCCYGCGVEGNQIDYLMEYEKLTYEQAVYLLAEIFMIKIPNNPYNSENNDLILPYQQIITGEYYYQFLNKNYKKVSAIIDNADQIYAPLFAEIERIKNGTYIYDLETLEKTQKYKVDKPLDLKRVPNAIWNPDEL